MKHPVLGLEIPERTMAPGEVHVWTLGLDIGQSSLTNVAAVLSPDESQRADRFRFEVHRRRFIAGRGLLRAILAHYCGIQPEELRFGYGPNGKPELRPDQGMRGDTLHFNLAHSEEVGVLAITRAASVGVDVEHVRRLSDCDQLVRRFFSARETAEFAKVAWEDQPAAFFNLWTRKEALLKATGEGIGQSLDQVEVSFLPGLPARVLSLPAGAWAGCEWSLFDLVISPSYAGALAVPVGNAFVSQFQLPVP